MGGIWVAVQAWEVDDGRLSHLALGSHLAVPLALSLDVVEGAQRDPDIGLRLTADPRDAADNDVHYQGTVRLFANPEGVWLFDAGEYVLITDDLPDGMGAGAYDVSGRLEVPLFGSAVRGATTDWSVSKIVAHSADGDTNVISNVEVDSVDAAVTRPGSALLPRTGVSCLLLALERAEPAVP